MDRTQALATLKAGVEAMATSEQFIKALEFRSKFHDYSFRNTIMIWCQRKDASHVAGFNAWKSMGRNVKKGEKGIAILAPMMFAKKDKDTGEKTGTTLGGFRVVHVFDVLQTEGKPIPADPMPEMLSGTEGADLFDALSDFATHGGLTVLPAAPADDLGADVKGDYSKAEKRIRILQGMPMTQRVKTLAHECAHWILHTSDEGSKLSREAKETEAEGAAFLALAQFGIPTDAYSFAYIAGWAGGDVKLMEASLTRIQKASDEIVHAIKSRIEEPELVAA